MFAMFCLGGAADRSIDRLSRSVAHGTQGMPGDRDGGSGGGREQDQEEDEKQEI